MTEYPTDLPFLGERDYLHGTTLLAEMLAAIERETAGPLRVRTLRFRRETRSNGRIAVYAGASRPDINEASTCHLVCDADGQTWRAAFLDEGKPVTRRIDAHYDIGDLRCDGFSGSCRIAAPDRAALIGALVEVNKRIHVAGMAGGADIKVRFGYLEDWAVPAAGAATNSALTVSNVAKRAVPEGITTVNRLTYDAPRGGGQVALTIGFHAGHQPA